MFGRWSRVLPVGARVAGAACSFGLGYGLSSSLRGVFNGSSWGGSALCEGVDIRSETIGAANETMERLRILIAKLEARVALASYIDHTCLKPDATTQDIDRLCAEAAKHGFRTVCVNGSYVRHAYKTLKRLGPDHGVEVCAVVGFPLGSGTSSSKAFETAEAIRDGATEIDMVVNVGRIKSGDWDFVLRDIAEVVNVCKRDDVKCKVIIETCLLDDSEKRTVATLCAMVGADFVKTSTGFSNGGATVQDVELLANAANSVSSPFLPKEEVQVKASGGIKTAKEACAMIRAGASRVGTSKGAQFFN
mmetsp:Transcript_4912/g.7440  ORF Transcript_4912/g.7440 Transcript_4912/m.7440 type:complete len:305 (-) Transcript_4912:3046-3960(-)